MFRSCVQSRKAFFWAVVFLKKKNNTKNTAASFLGGCAGGLQCSQYPSPASPLQVWPRPPTRPRPPPHPPLWTPPPRLVQLAGVGRGRLAFGTVWWPQLLATDKCCHNDTPGISMCSFYVQLDRIFKTFHPKMETPKAYWQLDMNVELCLEEDT